MCLSSTPHSTLLASRHSVRRNHQQLEAAWWKQRPASFKKKIILMQGNALSHAARYTISFRAKFGFKGEKLMTWPPASQDLNPIENCWSILKQVIYCGGQQCTSKHKLWHNKCKAPKSIEDKICWQSTCRGPLQ